jgi:uncharacterized protein (DUF934 family)
MPKIILDGSVVEDRWNVNREDAPDSLAELGESYTLVPLNYWNALQAESDKMPANIGVWIASTELPNQIEGDLQSIPVIAVDFPAFSDGQGFSIGRLLRQRHEYLGQLRAIGNPIRDQLSYLVRCGFNAFQLAEHYDPEQALASLKDFSDAYQTAADQTIPLFRGRG